MVDTNTRNIAWASIGVFTAGLVAFMAYQAGFEERHHSDDEDDQVASQQQKPQQQQEDEEADGAQLSDKYTEAKLIELLEVAHLELQCGYVRQYNNILRAGDRQEGSKRIKARDLRDWEQKTRAIMKQNTQGICDEYCVESFPKLYSPEMGFEKEKLTLEMYMAWIDKFNHVDKVRQHGEQLQTMHEQIFESESGQPNLTPVDCSDQIPSELTKDVYLFIFRQIWAILRHELYKGIVQNRKDVGYELDDQAKQAMFQMLYEETLDKFEKTRTEVYEKVLEVKLSRPQEAKINMLKAFVTFCSQPGSGKPEDGGRNRWSDNVEEITLLNQQYVQDMFEGQFPPDIGQDPRQAPNPFKKQSQSTALSKSAKLRESTKQADAQVSKSEVVDSHIAKILASKQRKTPKAASQTEQDLQVTAEAAQSQE